MRIVIIFLLILPSFVDAQINRSATELAREKIQEYIETKLFKDMPYKIVSYGDLKPYTQPKPETTWTIEHIFEITETKMEADKKITVRKPYRFFFFLDKKINVVGAENIQGF